MSFIKKLFSYDDVFIWCLVVPWSIFFKYSFYFFVCFIIFNPSFFFLMCSVLEIALLNIVLLINWKSDITIIMMSLENSKITQLKYIWINREERKSLSIK